MQNEKAYELQSQQVRRLRRPSLYFNAFEWEMLQVSSRRSDTPTEARSADGECVSLLTMSKRMNDPGDFVIGNVSKFLGAKLRLQIFLQDPLVIVWVRSFLFFKASL